MSRRSIHHICFALISFVVSSSAAFADRPNVVVFLSDDQGWGDLSISGNGDLATPNIDSLARDGASFDRFFVCPVCSPTRAEFLTGRHHARSGVYSTSAGGERMNLDETTIGDLFKTAGYRTGAFGKWHNGMQYPYHPNGRGFEEFYGFCSGHWGNYFDALLERNGRIVTGKGYCIDDFTEQAMNFIETSVEAKRPFFAYLPYNTPHSPMQVPDSFWEKFAEKPLNFKNQQRQEPSSRDLHKRCALAMCENLDWNVGRLLKLLDELEISENTIVVWFHDNGPNGVRWNGGMKGQKGSTNEGGCRSPLFIRWPAGIKAGRKIPQICTARDLLPTLCDQAGISSKTGKPLDGMSLKPLLEGKTQDWPDRLLVNQWRDRTSIRSQRYRLDHEGKLFDMVADPGQRKSVDNPEVLEKLSAKAKAHRDQFMPDYFKDDRPFVIAHPDSPFTQLPARDAIGHGNIKRSNKFPNCSYFLNWTSVDDKITFKTRVAETGQYNVVLYYAAKDAGAKCELRFNNSILKFQIEQPHNVPQRGAKDDRYKRAESYVKDFKAIPIGTIELKQGEGDLTLKATEIPGREAMEFRLLTLERVK
ncbi:MAG: N-acetylgalactosamine 6-sulfate sulfatase [Planctomycetaceae bacterium]|nr:N-acetylgalactosamine 6-sulfate sulfatase [Planctomycetaceae bacterium]